jgi:hypothetical protein
MAADCQKSVPILPGGTGTGLSLPQPCNPVSIPWYVVYATPGFIEPVYSYDNCAPMIYKNHAKYVVH